MIVEADAVFATAESAPVLQNESLRCRASQVTALVGPSGCGKTTLLHCLGLLVRPDSGQIRIDGSDTTKWKDGRRRKFWAASASFIFQEYGIIDAESVLYNVTMRPRISRRAPLDTDTIAAVLHKVGLEGRGAERAAHLSGGEKQRLAIARALYKGAQVILADEPTASLDADSRDRVIALLDQLATEGKTVVVATHDPHMMQAAHRRHSVGGSR